MPLAPEPARARTGKRVAVVGSGPAGLAAAQQLARAGHDVVVFERDDRIGGLLRYGIPDFKMEKGIIDARIEQMRAEGVTFRPGVVVGRDVRGEQLLRDFDAVVLAHGRASAARSADSRARAPRRALRDGVPRPAEPARRGRHRSTRATAPILATGKRVVVIGGGDTGSDCVGTSLRQGASSVTQLELMPKPALVRMPTNPWPEWPLDPPHVDVAGRRRRARLGRVDASFPRRGRRRRGARDGAGRARGRQDDVRAGDRVLAPGELVLLAMGFVGPERGGLVEQLGLALDPRGNVRSDASGATSVPGVFAAGDVSRGQSLVVWAIADGRRVAAGIDAWLRRSHLARTG